MSLTQQIKVAAAQVIKELYTVSLKANDILVNQTKPEFTGDYTIVLFSLIKQLKKNPETLGKEIGDRMMTSHPDLFTGYNLIKGFLNLSVQYAYFTLFLSAKTQEVEGNKATPTGQKVMVEYSSPNTNKPLHLGHLRNNFLGWSVAEILKARGHEVMK
ncbi:MAG: arginine--tRNA ligase domain-containing protein, partial [Flavisolibacter sp.]